MSDQPAPKTNWTEEIPEDEWVSGEELLKRLQAPRDDS